MKKINKEFFKKNFSTFHIAGMAVFLILAIFYWWKSGQYAPQFYKNTLGLVIVWGLLVGWITGDFIYHSRNK